MKRRINIWSFILSVVCILLFCIISTSGPIEYSILGNHPYYLVLFMSLIALIFGVIGFSGIEDWKGMARSVSTVIITLGLSIVLMFVLFFGSLLG